MKKYRAAFIGAGAMGSIMAQTYAHCPDIDIVSVFDTSEDAAQTLCAYLHKTFGMNAKPYKTYESMYAGSIYDIAIIACPPNIQVAYACKEMNRGVHVMTQVPAAFTIEECWELVRTVQKTGVKYQIAEQTRYWHFFEVWREMAQRNEFGKILYAEGSYLHYEPKWDFFVDKATGQKIVTNDMGYQKDACYEKSWRYRVLAAPILYLPHTLGPLLSVTGGRISKVAGFGTRKGSYVYRDYEGRDLEQAIMYNNKDIIFSVKAGFTAPCGGNRVTGAHWYQIRGTEMNVELSRSDVDISKKWTVKGGWESMPCDCVNPNADSFIRGTTHGGADYWPIHYFIDSIKNDTQPPMNVYNSVETAAPAILAARSCELGGVMLDVPDFRSTSVCT